MPKTFRFHERFLLKASCIRIIKILLLELVCRLALVPWLTAIISSSPPLPPTSRRTIFMTFPDTHRECCYVRTPRNSLLSHVHLSPHSLRPTVPSTKGQYKCRASFLQFSRVSSSSGSAQQRTPRATATSLGPSS